MEKAAELAAESCGHTRPNPPVGAVIVKHGKIVGMGRHVKCGLDHAEVAAIKNCKESAEGATLYVTLEPCSRPGRVGACTDAIIASGIRKVVFACPDPNAANKNRAKKILSRANIKVECWAKSKNKKEKFIAQKIWESLLKPFAKHVTTSLPYVTVKLAMSLDGKICDNFGSSQWISCKDMLRETSTWREKADVVMVGANTVRCDNPSLLCHTKENKDLYRAIISKSGKLPRDAQIFTDEAKERTLVYSDVKEAIEDLGRRGFMSVLCEGGLSLASSLVEHDLVDEFVTILCPIVIGNGKLSDAKRFAPSSPMIKGTDVMTRSFSKYGECPFL
jgi:diaminohydroxyphosphoribosylaminopyrimidine deaminase/5-amino-6-(5-phosphoribosylamino)uracil reductase